MNKTVLWIYIVLLIGGGLMGFLKSKSQISLITSTVAAAILILSTMLNYQLGQQVADLVMAALLVVFAIRLAKTKKFMPSGMLLVVTVVALALRHLHFA